jgi:hypothetical protein
MSRIEFAVEKVNRLDENQAEALLDWLALRENRIALQQRLDDEIEFGSAQLKRGEKPRAARGTPSSGSAVVSVVPGSMAG